MFVLGCVDTEAGFNICPGIDIWEDVLVTYKHNFPNTQIINDDITNISGITYQIR